MSPITLTADQQKVKQAFTKFLLDPTQRTMVITGFAGTGKTTITGVLIDELPNIIRTANLLAGNKPLSADDIPRYVELTATTNKAAEALSQLVSREVRTIHSLLSLRVSTDYKTGKTELIRTRNTVDLEDTILFIDEASYIDPQLLHYINQYTQKCKVVFMGDPAQLTPVKYNHAPVFQQGYPTVGLEEVVRQIAGNPIIDLATAFRETVNTGRFFSFKPDGKYVIHMERNDFDNALLDDVSWPGWKSQDSKFLAWTNKRVIAYNHAINNVITGDPELAVGDYAICNKYIKTSSCSLRTDQLVQVTAINPDTQHNVSGWMVEMDQRHRAFLPAKMEDRKQALKQAKKDNDWEKQRIITDAWIDLRAAYACTVNKSQGSTYDRVYIDLDDISKCNNANTIARMLYVAVSRARHQVFLTGDII